MLCDVNPQSTIYLCFSFFKDGVPHTAKALAAFPKCLLPTLQVVELDLAILCAGHLTDCEVRDLRFNVRHLFLPFSLETAFSHQKRFAEALALQARSTCEGKNAVLSHQRPGIFPVHSFILRKPEQRGRRYRRQEGMK